MHVFLVYTLVKISTENFTRIFYVCSYMGPAAEPTLTRANHRCLPLLPFNWRGETALLVVCNCKFK